MKQIILVVFLVETIFICVSCGCKESGTIHIKDVKSMEILHVDNGQQAPVLTIATSIPAKKYGIFYQFKDTLVDTQQIGSGCALLDDCKRQIKTISIQSQQNGQMTDVSNAFRIQKDQYTFAQPISSLNGTCPAGSVLLLYDDLPYYGQQRFIVNALFSDNTILSDTTTFIDLIR